MSRFPISSVVPSKVSPGFASSAYPLPVRPVYPAGLVLEKTDVTVFESMYETVFQLAENGAGWAVDVHENPGFSHRSLAQFSPSAISSGLQEMSHVQFELTQSDDESVSLTITQQIRNEVAQLEIGSSTFAGSGLADQYGSIGTSRQLTLPKNSSVGLKSNLRNYPGYIISNHGHHGSDGESLLQFTFLKSS